MVFQNDIIAGASGAGGGYEIDQSIRFNDNDSANMSFTSGTPTDQKKGTWSFWAKRGNLGITAQMFNYSTTVGNNTGVFFDTSNRLNVILNNGAGEQFTSQVFRDPSSWYHIVVAVDTSQATGANRTRIYINGSEYSGPYDRNTIITQNTNVGGFAASQTWYIGRLGYSAVQYLDGYLAESHFIDGQQLAPTEFGETNNDGVWVPKAYAGTYGTNGFYITGEDSADLGADYSGNGNDFTSSGLTSDDQVTDTPTENYCTLNPLYGAVSYPATFSNGNLTASGSGGVGRYAISTMGATSGKWYSEVKVDSMSTPVLFRIVVGGWSNLYDPLLFSASEAAPQINSVLYMGDGRRRINNSDTTSWGATFTTGDVIGVAYDADTGKVWFAKNDSWQASGNPAAGTNPAATLTTGAPFYSGLNPFDSGTGTVNFGQLGFTYTPPTGFSALSTANLPTPAIKDGSAYFQTTLYTSDNIGAGGSQSVTGVGFQSDLSWIKNRSSGSTAHTLFDSVRGAGKMLQSDSTAAEDSNSIYGYLGSFDADGYTLTGGSTNANYINQSTNQYVSWNWLAANGTASNTDGSITSTVSANVDAGFSIVSWTAQAGTYTVGHGLGTTPTLIITKNRDTSGGPWYTFTTVIDGSYDYFSLDTTAAKLDDPFGTALPTSSVFSGTGNYFYSSGK